MSTWKFYAKAIVGSIIAGLGAAAAGMVGDMYIDPLEWIAVATAVLVALGAIWGTPNGDVAVRETPDGDFVAGPAAHNIRPGALVTVQREVQSDGPEVH